MSQKLYTYLIMHLRLSTQCMPLVIGINQSDPSILSKSITFGNSTVSSIWKITPKLLTLIHNTSGILPTNHLNATKKMSENSLMMNFYRLLYGISAPYFLICFFPSINSKITIFLNSIKVKSLPFKISKSKKPIFSLKNFRISLLPYFTMILSKE